MSDVDVRAGRNETVDALRVVAALLVCLFHFTATARMQESNFLRPLTQFGVRGIDVFFVISGFIVPLAMARARYTLASWPRFMARRLVRLEPPYLVSILAVIGVEFVLSRVGETTTLPSWSAMQIASHVGYWTAFAGYEWLTPVYWSLAIEFQFYLLIGLALPFLLSTTAALRVVTLLAVSFLSVVFGGDTTITIAPFLPMFCVGLATFFAAQELLQKRVYWCVLAVLGAAIFFAHGLAVTFATVGTAIVIATVRMPRIRWLAWLASISYSLYLLHVPIGMPLIAVAERLPLSGPLFELFAVSLGTLGSVTGAAILFRFVESPALRLASKIKYRSSPRAGAHAEPPLDSPVARPEQIRSGSS